MFLGAAEALREVFGSTIEPVQGDIRRHALEAVRAALGSAAVDEDLARGRRLSYEEAVALALGKQAAHVIERYRGPARPSGRWVATLGGRRLPSGSQVQTRLLSRPFELPNDSIWVPAIQNAFQLVLASVLEAEPRTLREVLH